MQGWILSSGLTMLKSRCFPGLWLTSRAGSLLSSWIVDRIYFLLALFTWHLPLQSSTDILNLPQFLIISNFPLLISMTYVTALGSLAKLQNNLSILRSTDEWFEQHLQSVLCIKYTITMIWGQNPTTLEKSGHWERKTYPIVDIWYLIVFLAIFSKLHFHNP